jgi:DhnA family fructose-bisphosphate aldolase class Ia
MPVMAEMQPGGFDAGPKFFTTENIALSARVAAELGADWLKVPYTDNFERVVQSSFVPTVMLGGVKVNDLRLLFESVWNAVQAGAAGVAIGRNIFQAEDPTSTVRALAAILHKGASIDEAIGICGYLHSAPSH